MTLRELGTKLSEMYNHAPKGDTVAMIHLFGIKYANEIKHSNYSKKRHNRTIWHFYIIFDRIK